MINLSLGYDRNGMHYLDTREMNKNYDLHTFKYEIVLHSLFCCDFIGLSCFGSKGIFLHPSL